MQRPGARYIRDGGNFTGRRIDVRHGTGGGQGNADGGARRVIDTSVAMWGGVALKR